MKVCSKCGKEKPLTEFYKDKQKKDGLRPNCKKCHNAATRQYKLDHREEINKLGRQWYAEHNEQEKDRCRKYHADHHTERSVYKKKYNAEHRDEAILYSKQYRIEHRDKCNATSRLYAQRYPERIKARAITNNAIAAGEITRPGICEICGKPCKPDAHHWSYLKEHWLDVIWPCRSCHGLIHAEEREILCQNQ